MEPVYTPVITLIRTVFAVMRWDITVEGAHHVPATGGAVLAANHVGYLDFTFIGYGARQQSKRIVRFAAKQEVFDHKVSGPLMRGMKHLPVDRYGKATDLLDLAADYLRRGELVGMFPEATISRSFVPAKAKSGAARMAMQAGVPLVPTAVWGSQRIMTKGRSNNFQRKVPISVTFGPPIAYEPDDDPSEVTRRLMVSVEALVDRVSREYPDEPADPDDAWWQPAHLGGTAPSVAESKAAAAAERAARRAKRAEERRAEREAAAGAPVADAAPVVDDAASADGAASAHGAASVEAETAADRGDTAEG